MSAVVWVMMGIAIWHFTILLPDRFYGGIVDAFLAALSGAVAGGFVASGLVVPTHNPPGIEHAMFAVPGAVFGLAIGYLAGAHADK